MKNAGLCCLMLFRTGNSGNTVKGLEEPVILTVWTDDKKEK